MLSTDGRLDHLLTNKLREILTHPDFVLVRVNGRFQFDAKTSTRLHETTQTILVFDRCRSD